MKKLVFVLVCMLMVNVAGAFAQASLADGDQLDISVKIDNIEENVTCVRDAIKPEQWYYVPNKPRLVEINNTKTKEVLPVFSLVKYQAKDPDNSENLLEGGVLQASVNLSLPKTGLDQVKKALAKHTNQDESKILIAPLSMSNAKIAVYTPGGELMGDAPIAPDIGPTFANQSIPIQINLTKLGADFSDALVKTTGGVLITYVFDYNGLTPKCGFKITVDWDQTFKHFSTQTKAKASYGKWFWSGNAQADIATVRESLVTNKCIKVESIAGEAFKAEEIDAYLMPILEKINDELFNIEAPEKVDPATAADPAQPSRKWGFSGAVSFSLKSVEKVKKGTTTYSMDRQMIVARQTVAGGLISLGNYPKDVQDKLIVVMPTGTWASAWYSLPDVGSAVYIGVTQVSLTVKVLDDKGKIISNVPQQTATWKESTGDDWLDAKGNTRHSLLFALASTFEKFKGKEDKLSYQQTFVITQKVGNKTSKMTFTSNAPIFNGEAAVSTPMSSVECIGVNGDLITWYGNDYPSFVPEAFAGKTSDLTNVAVDLKNSKTKKSVTGTLSPNTNQLYLLFDRGEDEELPTITGDFKFNSKSNGKTVSSKDVIGEMGEDIWLTDSYYLLAK